MQMRLPYSSERLIIVGSTGTGKTAVALWQLSKCDLENRPCYIFDYKGDDYIRRLNGKVISINKDPPLSNGVYIIRPLPDVDDDAVEKFLWTIWHNERCLLFFDETTMVSASNNAFKACLTQGRSKHIQMIMCSQRPVNLNRYVFSESDFFQLLRLNDQRDIQKIREITGADLEKRLVNHVSLWYDRAKHELTTLAPVPHPDESVKAINRKITGEFDIL